MRFLLDEDVPLRLLKVLRSRGHDVIRAPRSTSDPFLAALAKREERILITLDKDFTNTGLYPPSELTIIHVKLHPPYADAIIEAFLRLLDTLPAESIRGLIILHRAGSMRIAK